MNIFLSYNRQNSVFVHSIAHKLKEIDLFKVVFLDQDNVEPGQIWTEETQQALLNSDACIVFIGEQGIGKWQNKEVITSINRHLDSKGDFKVIPVIIPHSNREQTQKNFPWFLADIQWIEFANEIDPDAFQQLINFLLDPGLIALPSSNTIPYKGLDFFDVSDAPFFFGRTFDINWIFYKKLRLQSKSGNNFLAIVGDSGSGKSSFARAGILATIKAGRFAGSEHWKQLICSPEDNPLLKLSSVLQSSGIIADAKKMEDESKTDFFTLRRGLEIYGRKIVLMIDQFEEVITQCMDKSQREAFLKNLTEALKSQHFFCIITLRSDFYAAFSAFKEFTDLLETSNYTITSLDYNTAGDEWRRYMQNIIQKPAQLLGVSFDPVLVRHIIEDCKAINGILPALQLALIELWKKGKDKATIESADYNSLANGKGIAGIIEAHANNTWSILTRDGSDKHSDNLIKAIFIRLVEITGNKEDVRKTVNKTELLNELRSQFDQSKVEKALNALSGPEARLIRIKQDDVTQNTYWVEVIHEVLIRQWDMLRRWLNERREAIKYKNKLEQYIDDDNKLLTGKKLVSAEQWVRDNKDFTNAKINSLVVKSRAKVNSRKIAFGISLTTILMLALFARLYYPVYNCNNCTLVKNWESGNYTASDVHTLTLNGTGDLKYLQCFQNLDTFILLANGKDRYLSQAYMDLLPASLKQLSLEGFKIIDTISMKKFLQLRMLNVSYLEDFQKMNIADLDGLVEVNISNISDLKSLTDFRFLKNLEALVLSGLVSLYSLSGIENLKNLQALKLSSLINLSNLAEIRDLKELQTLSISDLPIRDLSEISNLNSLKDLKLSQLRIDTLTGIENLTNLQTLELFGGSKPISSIADIKNLKNLQTLALSNLGITGLSDLENMDNLKTLLLSDLHNLTSYSGVENLTTLQNLELSNLAKAGLPDFKNLKGLNTLTITRLNKDSLSGIKDLNDLKSLSLSGLPGLSVLSIIEPLKSLQSLILSDLNISSLSQIANLKNLKALSLSELNLDNLSGIDNFKNLHILRLSSLPNISFAGIEHLKNIRLLYMDNIGQQTSTPVVIPNLIDLKNLDSLIMRNIKLNSLDFINSNLKIKVLMHDNTVELPNGEIKFSDKAKKMKQTKFYNKSVLSPGQE